MYLLQRSLPSLGLRVSPSSVISYSKHHFAALFDTDENLVIAFGPDWKGQKSLDVATVLLADIGALDHPTEAGVSTPVQKVAFVSWERNWTHEMINVRLQPYFIPVLIAFPIDHLGNKGIDVVHWIIHSQVETLYLMPPQSRTQLVAKKALVLSLILEGLRNSKSLRKLAFPLDLGYKTGAILQAASQNASITAIELLCPSDAASDVRSESIQMTKAGITQGFNEYPHVESITLPLEYLTPILLGHFGTLQALTTLKIQVPVNIQVRPTEAVEQILAVSGIGHSDFIQASRMWDFTSSPDRGDVIIATRRHSGFH